MQSMGLIPIPAMPLTTLDLEQVTFPLCACFFVCKNMNGDWGLTCN